MKLTCLPVSLYQDLSEGRRTLADWFNLAAELGLDGVDISVAHLENRQPGYLNSLRDQAKASGVPIVGMVTYSDFTHPNPTERRHQIEELKANIQVAARLAVSFLRVTAGQAHPNIEQSNGLAWAVEGLTACLSQAADVGVQLLYENHSIGYTWTHFDFSYPADIFLEIVGRTEGTGLGVLYDTANTISRGDDPLEVLEKVKHRVEMIHVNDILRTGYFEPVLVGTGVAPIETIFKTMRTDGFDGWICLEEASRTDEEGFRRAVPYVDRIWEKVGGVPRSSNQF